MTAAGTATARNRTKPASAASRFRYPWQGCGGAGARRVAERNFRERRRDAPLRCRSAVPELRIKSKCKGFFWQDVAQNVANIWLSLDTFENQVRQNSLKYGQH